MRPLVVAHRGASGQAPENTTAAFDLAIDQGADGLELDVRSTQDRLLAVWHDVDVTRIGRKDGSTQQGVLSELTWDQIRSFDCGSWFSTLHPHLAKQGFEALRPLSLESVIDTYAHRISLFIEIKVQDVARATALFIDLWRRAFVNDAMHYVLSEDPRALALVHRAFPYLNLIQVVDPNQSPGWTTLGTVRSFITGIAPCRSMVDRNLVIAAHNQGLAIFPYAVNRPTEIKLILDTGVEGIITDFPADCSHAIDEMIAIRESQPAIA